MKTSMTPLQAFITRPVRTALKNITNPSTLKRTATSFPNVPALQEASGFIPTKAYLAQLGVCKFR